MEIKRYSPQVDPEYIFEDPEGKFYQVEDVEAYLTPRPIETGPKDGAYILVWDTYASCWFIAKWALHGQFSGEGDKDYAWCIGCTKSDRGFNTAGFPTHWLPLPPEVKR